MRFNKTIRIADKIISVQSPTFIVAEAGVNHNGDMRIAHEMVDVALQSGVDAVKFQSFKVENLIIKSVKKAAYQLKTSQKSESQFEMLKQFELSKEQTNELIDYCNKKGIIFLSTPFEKLSLNELYEMNVPAFKIAATDLTNIQFLRQVAMRHRPIILSAGMCYMEETERALDAIGAINHDVILLQCTSNYPIEDSEANIDIVPAFKAKFDILVGYSDHSQGVGASPYAVALGAKVIEKHFTLDKNMTGPDHKASITPDELTRLVREIRKVEQYVGNRVKLPTLSEYANRKSLQKCFVASQVIKQGDFFSEDNIVAKRTDGIGIPALYYDDLIGKTAVRNFNLDEVIVFE
jgi:N-acetylneuraminate synthase